MLVTNIKRAFSASWYINTQRLAFLFPPASVCQRMLSFADKVPEVCSLFAQETSIRNVCLSTPWSRPPSSRTVTLISQYFNGLYNHIFVQADPASYTTGSESPRAATSCSVSTGRISLIFHFAYKLIINQKTLMNNRVPLMAAPTLHYTHC